MGKYSRILNQMTVQANDMAVADGAGGLATASGINVGGGADQTARDLANSALQAALTASGIAAGASSDFSKISSAIIISVGPTGDYTTIKDAIDFLAVKVPIYDREKFEVTINLQDTFVMAEQLLVRNVDLGWITIHSDVEITVTRSSLVADLSDSEADHKPAFGAENATLPYLDARFTMDTSGTSTKKHGVMLTKGSNCFVSKNFTFWRCGADGLYAIDSNFKVIGSVNYTYSSKLVFHSRATGYGMTLAGSKVIGATGWPVTNLTFNSYLSVEGSTACLQRIQLAQASRAYLRGTQINKYNDQNNVPENCDSTTDGGFISVATTSHLSLLGTSIHLIENYYAVTHSENSTVEIDDISNSVVGAAISWFSGSTLNEWTVNGIIINVATRKDPVSLASFEDAPLSSDARMSDVNSRVLCMNIGEYTDKHFSLTMPDFSSMMQITAAMPEQYGSVTLEPGKTYPVNTHPNNTNVLTLPDVNALSWGQTITVYDSYGGAAANPVTIVCPTDVSVTTGTPTLDVDGGKLVFSCHYAMVGSIAEWNCVKSGPTLSTGGGNSNVLSGDLWVTDLSQDQYNRYIITPATNNKLIRCGQSCTMVIDLTDAGWSVGMSAVILISPMGGPYDVYLDSTASNILYDTGTSCSIVGVPVTLDANGMVCRATVWSNPGGLALMLTRGL
jgi:hypothetical protein